MRTRIGRSIPPRRFVVAGSKAIMAAVIVLGGVFWQAPAGAANLSDAVLEIAVNDQAKGEFFAFQTADGDYLLRRADLQTLGLSGLQVPDIVVEGEPYVSLRSVPDLTFRLDPKTLTLQITAAPTLLGKGSSINLLPTRRPGVLEPQDTSAFVNYRLGYTNAGGFDTYTAASEVGVRAGKWSLLTGSAHVASKHRSHSVRLLTSLTHDRRDSLQRFIVGDFFTQPTDLGSTLAMGGLSMSKLYSMDPYLVTQPMADLAGAIGTASEAKIYVDGMAVRTQKLLPGEFEIQNLNYYGGARDVEIVIRDAFGREQQYTYRYYFTDSLLRAGLEEYSYNIGSLRRNFGTASNDYGPFAISFFHRAGITDNVTLSVRGEMAQRRLNLGPRATVRLGTFGVASLSLAASRNEAGAAGGAAQLNYAYQTRTLNMHLLGRRFTREYALATGRAGADARRTDTSAGLGWGHSVIGNFGIGYTSSTRFGGAGRRAATLSYSRSIGGRWNLFATLSHVRDTSRRNEFFVGLSWYPARDVSTSFARDTRFEQRVNTIDLYKNVPFGEGWGYRLTAARSDDGGMSASPFVQYNSRHAIYTAGLQTQSASGLPATTTYDLGVAGAIGYVGNAVGASRPISDSFGVVKVGNVPNVRVYQSNQVVGRTSGSGTLFIPNLAAYVDNQIAIEDKDVPLDYSITDKEMYVSPPYRSGSLISFNVKRVQAFTGTLQVRLNGALGPLEYADGSLLINGKRVDVLTGKAGVFYMENLAPGSYPLTMTAPTGMCGLNLTIPHSADAIIDLGSVLCESIH